MSREQSEVVASSSVRSAKKAVRRAAILAAAVGCGALAASARADLAVNWGGNYVGSSQSTSRTSTADTWPVAFDSTNNWDAQGIAFNNSTVLSPTGGYTGTSTTFYGGIAVGRSGQAGTGGVTMTGANVQVVENGLTDRIQGTITTGGSTGRRAAMIIDWHKADFLNGLNSTTISLNSADPNYVNSLTVAGGSFTNTPTFRWFIQNGADYYVSSAVTGSSGTYNSSSLGAMNWYKTLVTDGSLNWMDAQQVNTAVLGSTLQNINAVGAWVGSGANSTSNTFSFTGFSVDVHTTLAAPTRTWSGTGGNTWDTTTQNWDGANLYSDSPAAQVVFGDVSGHASFSIDITGTSGSNTVSPASVTVNNSTTAYTINSGAIAGSGNLLKQGSGSLTIRGAHSFSGGASLEGGTTAINNIGGLGDETRTATIKAATLEILDSLGTITTTRAFKLGDASSTIKVDAGATFTVNAVVSDVGVSTTGKLNVAGAGTLALLGNNTYSLGTAVSGGATVQVNSATSLGTATSAVSLDNGTIEVLASGADITSTRAYTLNAGGGTLNVGSGRTLVLNAAVGGGGGLTKSGPGILTLGNAAGNSYGGNTTVSNGTLRVSNTSGSATGSGAVTLAPGTTLTGSGFISGSVASGDNVAGGATFTPGGAGAFGTLSTGSLTLNGVAGSSTSTNLSFDLRPVVAVNDQIVASALSIGGSTLINIANAGGMGNGTYHLIQYDGAALADLTNIALGTVPTLPAGSTLTLGLSTSGGHNYVDLAVSIFSATKKWFVANGTWEQTQSNWTVDGSTATNYLDGDTARFDDTATGSSPIAITVGTGGVLPVDIQVAGTKNYTITSTTGNVIGGSTGVTKSGSSTLTLVGPNSFTGAVQIKEGVVSIGTIANQGTAQPLGAGTSGVPIGLGDTSTSGKLSYTGASASTNVGFGIAAGGGTIEVTQSGTTLTLTGATNGTGALTKAGAGTLMATTGTARNYAHGDTTVSGGVLYFAPYASPATATTFTGSFGTGTITVDNATFRFAGRNTGSASTLSNNWIVTSNGGTIDYSQTGSIDRQQDIFSGTIALNGTLTLRPPGGGAGTYAGQFTNTITLNGDQAITYSGGDDRSSRISGNITSDNLARTLTINANYPGTQFTGSNLELSGNNSGLAQITIAKTTTLGGNVRFYATSALPAVVHVQAGTYAGLAFATATTTDLQKFANAASANPSTGTIGLDANVSTGSLPSIDLSPTGLNLDVRIGSSTATYDGNGGLSSWITYAGTITPFGTQYKLGGGGGALKLSAINALSGAGNSLDVARDGVGGNNNSLTTGYGLTRIMLGASNSYGGGTTVGSGMVLESQAAGALGTGNIVVGANGSILFSTASQNYSGQTLTITGGGQYFSNGTRTDLTVVGGTTVTVGGLTLAGSSQMTFESNGSTLRVAGPTNLGGNTLSVKTVSSSSYDLLTMDSTPVVGASGGIVLQQGNTDRVPTLRITPTATGLSDFQGNMNIGGGVLVLGQGTTTAGDGPSWTQFATAFTAIGTGGGKWQLPSSSTAGFAAVDPTGNKTPVVIAAGTAGLDTNSFNRDFQLGSNSVTANLAPLEIQQNTTLTATRTITTLGSSTDGIVHNFSGNIGESTVSGLTKAGGGTLKLSGTNTYSGVTTVSAGVLQFAKQVSLYTGNSLSWTDTNLVVSSGATLALNVGGLGEFIDTDVQTIAALGTSTTGFKSGAAVGLDTTNAAGGVFTYPHPLNNPNTGTNALSLLKLGTNTLELTQASTYSGGTTVRAGTLRVSNSSGSATGTGSVSISSGATLTSATTGIISGAVTASASSTIAPGGVGAIGSLSVGGLTLNSAALNFHDIASPFSLDQLTDTGALSVTGTINVVLPTSLSSGTYTLMTYASGTGFTTSNFQINGSSTPPTGYTLALDTTAKQLKLTVINRINGTWLGVTDSWSDSGNWFNGVPTTAGDTANFAGTGIATVSVDGPKSMGHIAFNQTFGAMDYTIGGSALTLDTGDSSNATISVAVDPGLATPAHQVIAAPISLSNNVDVSVADGSQLTLGAITANGKLVTKTDAGTLAFTAARTALDGGLTVTGGKVEVASSTSPNAKVLVVSNGLSLAAGTLDLKNNALAVHTTSDATLTEIAGKLHSGIIQGASDSNHGPSVLSAQQAIANGHAATAGVFDFNGENVSGKDVLVQFGWNGDLNMDNVVDYLDYGVIDNGYLSSGTTYAQGDITLDGVINYLDYGMMDNAYLAQTAPHVAALSSAAVPEPAALGLLSLGALGLLARRRRHQLTTTDY